MAANGISTLASKQARQVAKLDAAQTKRQAGGDTTDPAYRSLNTYDINLLPTQFSGNSVIDNAQDLVEGRPWIRYATNGLSLYLNPASYPGTGNTWADSSGNGFDQTLYNAPAYTAGTPSYFTFNGVNEYSVGSTPYVIPPNTYTKIVWFQLNGAGDNNLVSSTVGGHFMFFAGTTTLWVGNANNPPFGPGGFGSNTNFSTGTWYCAAVVFSAPQIWIYVNGVEDAYDVNYGPAHTGDGSTNIACFGPNGNLLNGNIGEVFCYGRALSAAEILQVYNATKFKY